MSEKFEVPEEYVLSTVGGRLVHVSDLPRIVRAEVERALNEASVTGLSWGKFIKTYLADRYGGDEASNVSHTLLGAMENIAREGPKPRCPNPHCDEGVIRDTGVGCDVCRSPARFPEPPEGKPELTVGSFDSTVRDFLGKAPSAETATPERCPHRHPTGKTQCSLAKGHEGNHADWGGVWALCDPVPPSCTACPCARCQSEREFVRASAEYHALRIGVDGPTKEAFEVASRVATAARAYLGRVTEGR